MTDETPTPEDSALKAYEEAREKAATTFDLKARLSGRGLREGQVTLYLDEATGEKLGYARDVKNALGMTVDREREGVLGKLDEIDSLTDAEIKKLGPLEKETLEAARAELQAERDKLIAALEESAIVVKLRAVPPVISKAARRKAKESLGIKGKVGEDQIEEFAELFVIHVLSDTIVSITDRASGAVNTAITYEDAKALREFLPEQQFRRLNAKLDSIQFTDAVDESIQSDEDF